MIAATDPQEYIPGGRQQALRHPGPPETFRNVPVCIDDELLRDRLEKVSLTEADKNAEWWTVRKMPNFFGKTDSKKGDGNSGQEERTNNRSYTTLETKSQSDLLFDDSWSCRSVDVNFTGRQGSKRLSDVNASKFLQNKRFSLEADVFRSESKTSSNKSQVGASNDPKSENIKFKTELGYMEEELYVRGNVAVWSKGLSYNSEDKARTTICCYSSPFPIKCAIWCTFFLEQPDYASKMNPESLVNDKSSGEPLPCVCIVDTKNVRVYTADNEDFINTMPFQIRKVWSTKFGIFVEKEVNDLNKNIPAMIFSLSHPLDEITPVCIYRHGCMHTVEESNLQIVFTSVEPSICMVYDTQNGQHSVYKIRRISADEPYDTHKSNMTTPSGFTVSKFKTHLSAVDEKNSVQRVRSPFGSKTTSMTSVTSQNPSRVHTPLGGLSRCHTPAISPMLTGSPWLMRLSRLHSSINHSMHSVTDRLQTEMSNQTYRTMEPMVCIEHVWTENSSQDGSILGAATNVFLSEDMTGQWYLCYFVPSRAQLSIVKVDFSNPSCHVFGIMTSIGARDAVGIPHLHMLAVLDHTGNITLYSGLSILGKLHIGGVLAQHVPSPFAVRKSLSFSPFPRRSSLLPTSGTHGSDPRFDEHLLSPVLPSNVTRNLPLIVDPFRLAGETSKVYLNGLRDAVQDRITLQYSDGSYYRITLPNIVSTSLVESCLNILRQTLQRDVTITLLTRWYSTRNSPGSGDVTVESEWNLFGGLLLELMGYDNDHQPDVSATPTCAPKRQKQHLDGSDNDWTFLLATDQHKTVSSTLTTILQFRKQPSLPEAPETPPSCPDCNSVLFPYMKVILYSLHLLYEDLKLNVLRRNELPLLAKFLSRVSSELGLQYYVMHYWRDFPVDCPQYSRKEQGAPVDEFKNFVQWNSFTEKPCSILEFLYDLFRGEEVEAFPVINNINNRTRDIIQLCATYIRGSLHSNQNFNYNTFIRMVMPLGKKAKSKPTPKSKPISNVTNDTPARKVVVMMTEMKINSRDLESYPMGINFLLHEALWSCRENPPTDWSADAYHLLQRPDLASQAQIIDTKKQSTPVKNKYAMFSQINEVLPIINQVVEGEQEDGMEDVDGSLLKLRFSEDLRVAEARRLLQSSKPVPIVLVQRPDVSDHDFIEEQEKHLYAICTRTMALPVGRGMFTLRTATPVATEPLPVPALCLTGKAPPRGTTVELTHIDTPANMNLWPLFHNGVANGLRIDPEARNIDSNWIVFNKPKTTLDTIMEHVGFLVALGLNGHLRNLNILNMYNYLTKLHEMTTLGLLLGLSCAFRATNNMQLTKTLSVHVEGLLPPTSMELDVPQNVQVACLMGVGLVYQGSAHRHMTEILLTEIGRPPGPEMENSVDRESYSLTAGLALGLVMLRQGGRPSGLSDLNVPDTLHYYMVGGNKRNFIGSQKEKYKVPSFQIREGSSVNLDITAPGATLALGLMYLGTGNRAIADWMAPPDTQYLLDFVRPDFLMLRTLSRALILWHSIEAEKDWVEKQVPQTIKPYCMVKPSPMLDIDYEAMNQAYCNIIAGACFALGLKFAGSADETAFQTLLEYCHMFTSLTSKSIADLAGKPTIETCLNVVLLSVSMVMAGTGNLEIMRIVRYLRRRVGLASSAIVTYGSHLAIHMALGLLFLGGGRYTLSNSPASVAALICAFYPKFPTHSNDNRYHLQAFRHLYVLAVEPRLVIPKDITMGRMCYANISVIKMDGTTITFRGPGLIPDLNTLYKVSIKDERYWPIVFERERNWEQLLKLLSSCCCIDVKQRAGCLSYSEDKLGLQSEMARTLTQSDIVPWDPPSKTIASFSSDCIVRHFVDHFLFQHEALKGSSCVEEEKLKRNLTRATYDCVVKDKLSVLPLFINIIKIVQDLQQPPTNSLELWHLKMIFALLLRNDMKSTLTNSECALSFHQQTLMLVDNWEPSLRPLLKSYILGESINCDRQQNQKLAGYVTFYNIPYNFAFNDEDLMELVCKLNQAQCNSETVDKVLRILSYIR